MKTPTSATGDARGARARRGAFTLAEIIVVLVLLAVVLGMTIARLSGAVGSAKLKEQANCLLIAARHARDYAVTHRCNCRLAIDAARQAYHLEIEQQSADGETSFVPMDLAWGRPQPLGEGLTFGRVSIQQAQAGQAESCVTFRPSGQADAAIVELTDGNRVYSLLLLPPTGRAKLVDGHVDQLPDDREDLDARRT